MNKIVIGRLAYDKIMYYVKKTKLEISGLGVVENIDGVPTVTDIVLLKQTNDKTETELDANAIGKADYDHFISGKAGELKFWWHSHNTMPSYWSKTDYEAMETLTGESGWFFHGVFNHKEETQFAYTDSREFDICIDDIGMEIDETIVTQEMFDLNIQKEELNNQMKELKNVEFKYCDEQYDELVTEEKFSYGATYFGNTKVPKVSRNANNLALLNDSGYDSHGKWSHEDWSKDWEDEDEDELASLGFTTTQIHFLKQSCDVNDIEDLIFFEGEVGMTIDQHLELKGIA